MGKIDSHKSKNKIEEIILQHKFKGLGSSEIQKALLNKLAFNVSRPTIDEYYTKHMHGELMTLEIGKAITKAILSVSSNGDNLSDNVRPAFDDDSESIIFKYLQDWKVSSYADELENQTYKITSIAYSKAIALMMGNVKAHEEGKERLKLEYIKYIKELHDIMRGNF